MTDTSKPAGEKQFGEGSYEGAKDNHDRSDAFIAANKDGKIEELARDAEDALDGPEGDDLAAAEKEGRSHAKK